MAKFIVLVLLVTVAVISATKEAEPIEHEKKVEVVEDLETAAGHSYGGNNGGFGGNNGGFGGNNGGFGGNNGGGYGHGGWGWPYHFDYGFTAGQRGWKPVHHGWGWH